MNYYILDDLAFYSGQFNRLKIINHFPILENKFGNLCRIVNYQKKNLFDRIKLKKKGKRLFYACLNNDINSVKSLFFEKSNYLKLEVHISTKIRKKKQIIFVDSVKRNLWLNQGLLGACSGGHLELANFLIAEGANNFNTCLKEAFLRDHFDFVTLMLNKGADKTIDLVELMVKKNADKSKSNFVNL